MGLFKWLIGYGAAKHFLFPSRSQRIDLRLHVEVPDVEDADTVELPCREEDWTRPPIYDRKGREIDEDGFLLTPGEKVYRQYRRMESAQRHRLS